VWVFSNGSKHSRLFLGDARWTIGPILFLFFSFLLFLFFLVSWTKTKKILMQEKKQIIYGARSYTAKIHQI
jgi:hypothetical protein